MPFRGKLSKGCKNCRIAKRRCDLERPSCLRCQRLGKACSGYRDIDAVRIFDETDSVRQKFAAEARSPSEAADPTVHQAIRHAGLQHFYDTFAARDSKWTFLQSMRDGSSHDSLLETAQAACGLALMSTMQQSLSILTAATTEYGRAIVCLQKALQESHRRRSDDALIATGLLSCYENILGSNNESVESWRSHIAGTAQLLALRGKAQLHELRGRMLYRLLRTQVAIDCVWDDLQPPAFLLEYESELENFWQSDGTDHELMDRLFAITLRLALFRHRMREASDAKVDIRKELHSISACLAGWADDAKSRWAVQVDRVIDDSFSWKCTMYTYTSNAIATTLNYHRVLMMMITRAQEMVILRSKKDGEDPNSAIAALRSMQQQYTDEICFTFPNQIGWKPENADYICPPPVACEAVWPLFFAASSALALVEYYTDNIGYQEDNAVSLQERAEDATAQALWLIGRLNYISDKVGVKWADRFLAVLRGEKDAPFLKSSTTKPRPAKPLLPRDYDPVGSALRSLKAASASPPDLPAT